MPPPDRPGPGADAVLPAAVLAAAADGHLESTLHEVVQTAVDRVGATFGAIGILRADGRRVGRLIVAGVDPSEAERISGLPLGQFVERFVDQPTVVEHLGALGRVLSWDDLPDAPESLGFGPEHPGRKPFLAIPIRVGGALFGNLFLTEKRGGEPWTETDLEVLQALAAVAGLAVANARLAERAEQGRRWLQAGAEVATALLSPAELDDVLRSVAVRVARLTEADLAGVLVPLPHDDSALVVAAAAGAGADDVEGVRIPVTATHVGAVYRSGAPTMLDDVTVDPVVGQHALVAVELTHDFGPALMVPFGQGAGAGMIVAMRARGSEPFDAETLAPLTAFASRTALATELARSQRRERRLQVQADRDRIARDLHDHVVQRIFATGLSLDRLSRTLGAELPEVADRLALAVDELDATIAEIRSSIYELHEDDSSDVPVRGRLTDILRAVTDGHPLQRDLRLRGPLDDLPRELVPDLLAVVRELLTNVVRHAGASRVTLVVSADGEVQVVVTDNGRGLPQVTPRSGLSNLADRAERRGGRLTTTTGPDGTEVRWTIPWTSR